MNQRRIPLSQRNDRRSIFYREEIEPAPDRLIAALPQHIKIGATEMANFDIDFENTPAMRTLKGRSGSWLMSTLRTPKLAHCAHENARSRLRFLHPPQHCIPPPFQYSSLITLFSVRPRATTFPTPLPDHRRRNPRPERRPESRYRS